MSAVAVAAAALAVWRECFFAGAGGGVGAVSAAGGGALSVAGVIVISAGVAVTVSVAAVCVFTTRW